MDSSPTSHKGGWPRWPATFGLRFRMLVGFGLLFTVTLAVVNLVRTFGIPFTSYTGSYGVGLSQTLRNLDLIADLKKERLLLWLGERQGEAKVIAENQTIISSLTRLSKDLEEIRGHGEGGAKLWDEITKRESYQLVLERLKVITSAQSVYQKIQLIDLRTGQTLVSTDEKDIGLDASHEAYFLDALKQRPEMAITIDTQAADRHSRIIFSEVTWPGPQGISVSPAVIAMFVDSRAFAKPLLHMGDGLGSSGEVLLVDQDSRILTPLKYPTPDGTVGAVSKTRIQARPTELKSGEEDGTFTGRDYRGVETLAAYRSIEVTPTVSWGMVVKTDRSEVFAHLWERVLHTVILSLVGLLASGGLAILIAGRISAPIEELSEMAQRVESGDLKARAQVKGSKEVEVLASTFNSMIGKIERWHKELEDQVKARTIDLTILNTELTMEIGQRRQAEADLAAEKGRLAVTLRSIGDGVISADMQGKVVSLNSAAEKLTGWSEIEAVGKPLEEIFHIINELTRLRCENPVNQVLKTGLTIGLANHTALLSRDGVERVIADSGAPIHDEKGGAIGVVLVFRDVTEQRLAHEALLKSEKKYRTLFDESRDGVYFVMRDGEIVDGNASFLKMFGYARDELIGRDVRDLYANPISRRRFQEAIEKNGFVQDYQSKFRRKDGKEIDCILTSSVQVEADGGVIGYHGIIRDVTDQKRTERELLKAQKLESLELIAGGLAHDFNNLLTGIIAGISVAKLRLNPSESTFKALTKAEKAAKQATSLTRRLLTFARGGAPTKETTATPALFEDSAALILSGTNVKCEFRIPHDVWPVEVDQQQICQVIQNLVINAQQAMPEGGTVRIRTRNVTVGRNGGERVPRLADGKYVKIYIEDEGSGIPEEDLPRIFDPYFTTKPRGTGLGLAIAYSIVSKHGGHITVESRVGQGAKFIVYLPASNEPPKARCESIPQQQATSGRGRILVMDDDDIIRGVLEDLLVHLGYDVSCAKDGVEAIELYREAKDSNNLFDAVIMDLIIPGGTGGKTAIQRLLEMNPHVKAIASSGYSSDPIMSNPVEFGFTAVIRKPYDAVELSQTLARVIQGEPNDHTSEASEDFGAARIWIVSDRS